MNFEIMKQFEYKNRKCVIVKIIQQELRDIIGKKFIESHFDNCYNDYCNGYIEVFGNEPIGYEAYYDKIEDEPTFYGDLKRFGIKDNKTYLGFDTQHYYNWEHPETQKPEAVEKLLKNIVDELEKEDEQDD